GRFAVVLRGTVPQAGSVIEDLVSVMVAGQGTIAAGKDSTTYQFAEGSKAGVHLGFAVGVLLLLKDPTDGILARLKAQVPSGSEIYITGHSQGAAMATLLRSYLQYPNPDRPAGYSYKTYVFAQPKPGNDHYAADFERNFSNSGHGFRITNSLDWVPQVPFTIEIPGDIDEPNLLSAWLDKSVPFLIKAAFSAVRRGVGDMQELVANHVQAWHDSAARLLLARGGQPSTVTGSLSLPILSTLNFVNAGSEIALIGTPCQGDECNDGFFEHHAGTYYKLLRAQVPVV
ncbi:MAG: lipase family protein, partial [Acidobacteriota bacterium]